jgi:uncharacterized protein (DUF1501 family)
MAHPRVRRRPRRVLSPPTASLSAATIRPLAGGGTRAIAVSNTEAFLRQARLAAPAGEARNKAYRHILRVEADIVQAAANLDTLRALATEFPAGGFGNAVHTACQIIANPSSVAVVRLTLSGFDTHSGQTATQARLLGELAQGIASLKGALDELGRWNETLILTYAEFGRRPRENLSGGTDHGTASVHFALGGRVAGGFYGEAPALDRLGGDGNVGHAIDFRAVYATVLEGWWGVPSQPVLGGRYAAVPFREPDAALANRRRWAYWSTFALALRYSPWAARR